MKVTKKELRQIIQEELSNVHGSKEKLLKEDIKRSLMRPAISESDADFLAEWLIKEEEAEGPWHEPMTGATGVEASAMDVGAALPKALGGKGFAAQMELVGELLIWLPDWIPNLLQEVGKIQEEDVGSLIKGLRIASRIFGAPSKAIGHILLKASKMGWARKVDQLETKPEPEQSAPLQVAAEGRARRKRARKRPGKDGRK